jgi:LPS O-antigen subunit length determinant protein (WzzB/FepE family)
MVQGFHPGGSGRQFSDEMTSQDGGLGMSENEKDNTHEKDEKDLQDQQPVQHIQVAPYGWYSQDEDEIDLADLVSVLYKRRKLIVAVTILFVLLAFGASQLMTEKYSFSTILEIGKVSIEDELVNVEPTAAVGKKIAVFSEALAAQMSEHTGRLGFSAKNDLKVDAPEETNIITVEVIAPESTKDNAVELLNKTNNKIIQDHKRVFEEIEGKLRNIIAKEQAGIEKLDVQISNLRNKISELKREHQERTQEQQNAINNIEKTIENTINNREHVVKKINLLEKEQEDLAKRIQEVEARYSSLLDSKLASNEEARGADAVGLMLFNSEIMQTQNYLSRLRDRLLLEIPEAISQLEVDIKRYDNTLADLHEQKALQQMRLANLQPELNEKIAELEGQIKVLEVNQRERELNIEDAKNRLENMIKTSVIVEPRMSDEPVAPNVKLIVALGFVGGLFLAVFLAFMAEFWSKNKQKITG